MIVKVKATSHGNSQEFQEQGVKCFWFHCPTVGEPSWVPIAAGELPLRGMKRHSTGRWSSVVLVQQAWELTAGIQWSQSKEAGRAAGRAHSETTITVKVTDDRLSETTAQGPSSS